MADGRVNVEITGNAASLTGAAKQAAASLKSVETAAASAGKSASASLDSVDKAAAKVSTSATKAGSTFKTLEGAALSGANSLKNAAASAGQTGSKFEAMAGQSAKAALGLSGFGGGLASMINPLSLAGTAVVGLGQHAVSMAADFETSMAKLAVMTGVTDKSSQSFKELQAAAIKVGEDTKFSSQEAADGMADLAAAGLNVKDTIAAISPVAQAAAINQVSISDAAKVATVSMNAFGLSASQTGKVIDVTTTAANLGVLKFEDFGNAMAAVGSVAKLSNQGLTGVTSALIALTNNGQSAQDAGTSIKSALLALTNPSSQAADAMRQLGLNIYDTSGKMKPFAEIVKQVEQGTKGMTDAEKNQLLATIAGSDGIRAFSGALNATIQVQRDGRTVTLQGSEALEEFQRQLDNSGGAAQKAADILNNTFNARLEQTKGKIDELIRKLGDGLLPAANQFLDTLNAVFDNGPLKSATDQTTRNLDSIKQGLDKTTSSTAGLAKAQEAAAQSVEKHRAALQRLNEADNNWGKQSSVSSNLADQAALSSEHHRKVLQNLNAEIDRQGMAYQDTGQYYLLYAETTQQAWQSAEYGRKKMQALNEEIDYNGKSFATLNGPMTAISGKYGDLTGKVNSLSIAIQHLSSVNDELSGKISANDQLINTMSVGVDQLALKHQNAKIAFDGTNHSLQEGYDQWVKYTEVQAAGGDGALEAGKKAGNLAAQLVKVDGSFQPLLDTTYNAINANNGLKNSLVSNTEAAAKTQQQLDVLTDSQRKADSAFEEGAIKARAHGNALGVTAQGADTARLALDNANKVLGIWNSTPLETKKTDTSAIAAAKLLMEGAVAALRAWNLLPMANKSATATMINVGGSVGIGAGGGGGGGGSAPSPNPVRGPSSLSTTMGLGEFGGGKNAGNFAVLAQATQQAQAANFSLASLKSNIDQIVSMFKDIDSKALKAAADQAESVSKIAGAATNMVDLFAKIKDYASVGKEVMIQVSADSMEMTKQYIAGASQFSVKGLEGAATYIETSGKVASAASSMADALSKLKDWQGPINASIEGFAYNVKVLMANYYNASVEFNQDMLTASSNFADAAGKVADATGKGADSLAKLLDWKGIATVSIEGFVFNLRVLAANFYNSMQYQFTPDILKAAELFAATAGKVGEAAGKGADGLAKLKDWKGIATESIEGFVYNLKIAAANFYNASREFDGKMLKSASDFADTGTKVADAIGKGVSGLVSLKDYEGIATPTIEKFVANLTTSVQLFQSIGLTFQTEGLKAASDFAEAGGKVTGIIGKAVEGFRALDDYKAVAADKLTTFMVDLSLTMQDFQTAAENFKPEAVTATAAFAEGAGKITDGLGKAVSLFEGLAKYQGVPQKMLTQFLSDVRLTVQLAAQMVGEVDKSLMPQIEAFGGAIGKLFDGLSKAMGVFQGLEKYKSVPSAVITDFVNEIILTVNIAGTLADKTDKDLMDKATAFAKSVDNIFGKLKGAIDVFKGLETYKSDAAKTMQSMLEGIVEAIKKMGEMEGKAQELYDGAVRFANKMADAGKEIARGMSAIGSGGGGGGTSEPLSGFSSGSGGTGRGFALGGLVPNSGVYTVGEFGPEQVWLPGGSRVNSNMSGPTTNNNSSTTRVQGNVYITIAPPAGTDERKIAQMVQQALQKLPERQRLNQAAGYSPNRGY